jgi:hypothetical protein
MVILLSVYMQSGLKLVRAPPEMADSADTGVVRRFNPWNINQMPAVKVSRALISTKFAMVPIHFCPDTIVIR